MSRQAVKKATNFTTLVLIGALIIFSVYGYQKGIQAGISWNCLSGRAAFGDRFCLL